MTYFMALLIALSALFNTPTQAPSQPLSQTSITAPSQALTYEAPQVTTQPAPKAPEAPTQALSQAPVHAPTQAPICEEDMPCWDCHTMGNLVCGNSAPQAPVAPRCEEDMPCWDCATMGNMICGPIATETTVQPAPAPKVDPYSGNPIVDCAALGLLTAEDYSCVPASFYEK